MKDRRQEQFIIPVISGNVEMLLLTAGLMANTHPRLVRLEGGACVMTEVGDGMVG